MRLGDLLHTDVIKVGLKANTKEEAIEELVDVLIEAHEIPLSWREHAIEVVLEREQEVSTGMEYGVALPHGLSDRVDDIIAALGICHEGIPFNSIDGIAARIIILLLYPRRSFQGNVETMAGIAHLLRNARLREALKAAKTPIDVLRAIKEEEAKETFKDSGAKA